jgi:hypothetical protein
MHAGKKTGCWWLACSLALAARLSVLASADAEPGGGIPADSSSSEVVESPESGSRSLEGFPVPEGIEYPWFMPMFGVELCSNIDGYLCGVGVRVGTKAYFLASYTSVNRTLDTLNAHSEDAGPGVFDFGSPGRVDISKRNLGDGSRWRPEFRRMIRHNIGLYVVYKRSLGTLMPETGYPNKVSAPLQTKKGEIKKDCFLLSYGHKRDGGDGIGAPMRYKNYVPVRRIKCEDYSCNMETVRGKDDSGNLGGYICGILSELGAPVVCGYGPEETVDYIVSEVEIYPKSNCTYDFKALEVSGYGQDIIDQVAKWEKNDEQTNKHRPPRYGR